MALSLCLRKIQAARSQLLLNHPFWGVPALHLKPIEDPNCGTAWTDGKYLAFSPAFVETLSMAELQGVIAHEVSHCTHGHIWRLGARDLRRFNIAADYAINSLLIKAGFKLPKCALLDAKWDGKTAEWIYDRLPASMNGGGGGKCVIVGSGQGTGQGGGSDKSGNDPGGCGGLRKANTEGKDTGEGITEEGWRQITEQAKQLARAQGKLPANLQRELDRIGKPKVEWRSLLRKYIQDVCKTDYNFMRPNPRYMHTGFILPALWSQEMGRIAFGFDTSGSIDDVLFRQFGAEAQSIVDEVRPSVVDLMYCDAKLHRTDSFDRGNPLEFHPMGGGGTDFRPVFEALEDDPPVVLVYLTDLAGTFPNEAPQYPVIWASNGGTEAPFGEVVPIED